MGTEHAERLLIVNADDLGLAPGVTRGIVELARRGAITSTSALVNLPGSMDALAAARDAGLDVGLHLNLSAGAPLSPPRDVPTLLDRRGEGGRFATADAISRRYLAGRLRLDEVEREWAAQAERFLSTGLRPSHLDSHCHLHAHRGLYHLAVRLARRYGIPGVRSAYAGFIFRPPRLPALSYTLGRPRRRGHPPYQPDYFSVLTVMGPARTPRPLQTLLRALPRGVTELVCHPGHVDEELRRLDPLTTAREREWLLLSRPLFQATVRAEGLRLVSWREAATSMLPAPLAPPEQEALQGPAGCGYNPESMMVRIGRRGPQLAP